MPWSMCRNIRLKHIYDITVGRIEVERPASAETTGDGGRSAVVINDQRIFFGRIEIGRQIITSVDFDPAKKYPLIVYYYGGTKPCSVR